MNGIPYLSCGERVKAQAKMATPARNATRMIAFHLSGVTDWPVAASRLSIDPFARCLTSSDSQLLFN